MNPAPTSLCWNASRLAAIGLGVVMSCAGCDSRPPAAAAPPAPESRTVETTPDQSPAPDAPPVADTDLTPPDAVSLTVLRTSDAGLSVIAIEINRHRYEIELAIAANDRSRGFGGRPRFPAGTGMLFVHPDDQPRRYWMKDCLVDMDIAFLDRQGRIVAMHRMPAEPAQRENESIADYQARLPGYPSRRPARYALEVPPGDLERLGLRLGDEIPIPRIPLDALAAREILGARRR